jgi:hypothetical protein
MTSSYDHPDNIDSPFHRVVESEVDRKIKSVRDEFVRILKERLEEFEDIVALSFGHTPLSNYIIIDFKVFISNSYYIVKLRYDMDKHSFENCHYTFENGYSPSNPRLSHFLKTHPIIQVVAYGVIKTVIETNLLPGLGTRYGADWATEYSSAQLAQSAIIELLD